MDKLDLLDKRLDRLDVTSAVQAETLRQLTDILNEHMKRWEASEQRIEHLEKRWESHLGKVEGALKTVRFMGWVLTLSLIAIQLIDHIK